MAKFKKQDWVKITQGPLKDEVGEITDILTHGDEPVYEVAVDSINQWHWFNERYLEFKGRL